MFLFVYTHCGPIKQDLRLHIEKYIVPKLHMKTGIISMWPIFFKKDIFFQKGENIFFLCSN